MQSFLVFAPSFPELGKSSQQFDKYEIQSLKIEKKNRYSLRNNHNYIFSLEQQ